MSFRREQLHTVQLVPITAFDSSGAVSIEPMREHFQRMFDAGIRVIIPCAGSSEFHSLRRDEILQILTVAREVFDKDGIVVAPIGQAPVQAKDNVRAYCDAGAHCALVMPLSFPYLSDEGARDYYLGLLEAAPCPVMMYKKARIPSDTLLLELADHEQMIGVKYAVNNLDAFNQVICRDGGRIDWYCGSAERFAPFFALAGAPGYTSGAANVCPQLTLAMNSAIKENDWGRVMSLQRQLLPIEHYRARSDDSYNISFLKYAVQHTGLDFGEPRPPQRRLTPAERQEIDAMMPSLLEAESQCNATA